MQQYTQPAPQVRQRVRSFFAGRRLAVATMHGKEAVLAPLLSDALGVEPVVPAGLDTDRFGAFSGEVERTDTPLTAARRKALAAAELADCPLAVASEGSFGPHPQLYFVPADSELVVMIDREHDWEWVGHTVSTRTNFAHAEVSDLASLKDFARQVGFPEHGLVLKDRSEGAPRWLAKGLTDWTSLERAAHEGWRLHDRLVVETDMRAFCNPTRMSVIAEAADQLVRQLFSLCPSCEWPGFAVADRQPGLPCELCGLPTRQILRWTYHCGKCDHRHTVDFPDGRRAGDAAFCDFCNP